METDSSDQSRKFGPYGIVWKRFLTQKHRSGEILEDLMSETGMKETEDNQWQDVGKLQVKEQVHKFTGERKNVD